MKAITKVKSYRKLKQNHRKFAEPAAAESKRRSLQQDAGAPGPGPAPGPPPLVFPVGETVYNGAIGLS